MLRLYPLWKFFCEAWTFWSDFSLPANQYYWCCMLSLALTLLRSDLLCLSSLDVKFSWGISSTKAKHFLLNGASVLGSFKTSLTSSQPSLRCLVFVGMCWVGCSSGRGLPCQVSFKDERARHLSSSNHRCFCHGLLQKQLFIKHKRYPWECSRVPLFTIPSF